MGCGSYATMPYYRLPNGIPCAGRWIGERSACPSCGKKLRTRDLFPVFNWLWTKGQCFNCQAVVNPVYFFIEFSCMLLSILLYMRFGFDQIYIIAFGLAVCLVILAATQYSYQVIPDPVLIVIIMFGLIYRTIHDGQIYDMVQSFALAILAALLFARIYEKLEKVGRKTKKIKNYGLLKLFATSGIWFSQAQVIFYILALFAAYVCTLIFARLFGRSAALLLGGVLAVPYLLIVFYPTLPQAFLKTIISGGI